MEANINMLLIQAFIAYNRSYDEIKKTHEQIDAEKEFCTLGDCLEALAFEELIKAFPPACLHEDIAKEIMFDIVDAEELKALPTEQLAAEFSGYFIGEYKSRTEK